MTWNPKGFTLLELVVVLVIFSISLAMLLPRVGAGWKRMEDRDFLQEFVQTLKRARLIAMNSGEVVTFRLRGSERLYDLQEPPGKPVPLNVDIYADHLDRDPQTGDHVILFFPDGSISGRDVQIVFDQQRSFYISVHPITGAVQLSRSRSP
jgi:general secretion pathway protein H